MLIQSFLIVLVYGVLILSQSVGAMAEMYSFGERGCDSCKPGEYLERIEDFIIHSNHLSTHDSWCAAPLELTKRVGGMILYGTVSRGLNPRSIVGPVELIVRNLGLSTAHSEIVNRYTDQNGRGACKPVCGAFPEGAVIKSAQLWVSRTIKGQESIMEPAPFDGERTDSIHAYRPVVANNVICAVVANWSNPDDHRVFLDYRFSSYQPPIEQR